MKKSVLIMFHLLFWIFTCLLVMLVLHLLELGIGLLHIRRHGVMDNTLLFNSIFLLIVLPIGACIFYASYYSFNFFMKRPVRFNWIIISYILFIIVISLPGYWASQQGGSRNVNHLDGLLSSLLFVAPILYFNFFGFLFRTFIEWIGDRKIKAELEKDNIISQLELLKLKINPHFLFNTINNIDILIQEDAIKASEYLNKLSDIMRFMLYETKEEKISLAKELSYIKKYIELQKIRTTNPNYVKHEVKGEVGNLLIEPMLFIPFIENAFKHAENKKVENAIRICFDISKDKIKFECENAFSVDNQLKNEHSGLGNELIQRRLDLLYPNKHTFEVENNNGFYKVKLLLSV